MIFLFVKYHSRYDLAVWINRFSSLGWVCMLYDLCISYILCSFKPFSFEDIIVRKNISVSEKQLLWYFILIGRMNDLDWWGITFLYGGRLLFWQFYHWRRVAMGLVRAGVTFSNIYAILLPYILWGWVKDSNETNIDTLWRIVTWYVVLLITIIYSL